MGNSLTTLQSKSVNEPISTLYKVIGACSFLWVKDFGWLNFFYIDDYVKSWSLERTVYDYNEQWQRHLINYENKVTLDENITVLRNPENWRNMLSKFIM
jgi:hypothetical protein